MKTTLLLSLALLMAAQVQAVVKTVTLVDAVAQNQVSVTAVGTGGHTGKVLQIDLVNLGKGSLNVQVPAGTRFASEDPDLQDLMVTQDAVAMMTGQGKKRLFLYAMCTQRYNSSPGEGAVFTLNGMADGNLLKLAAYINQKKYQGTGGQSAIWTLISDEGLENVYDDSEATTKDLVDYMADITGKPKSWYQTQYNDYTPGPAVNTEPAIIHATYEYAFTEEATIKLAVYNEAGEEIFLIRDGQVVKPGKFGMKFKLTVQHMPKGNYYVRVFNNTQMLEERVVVI